MDRSGNGLTETHTIQAVLFDLMGVLLFLREDYAVDDIVNAVDDMIGGVVDDEAFRNKVMSRFTVDRNAFERILSHIPEKYEAFPPLWDLLPELRKTYRLGIINNGTRLTYPYFDAAFHFSRRFDLVVSSGAEGVCKPDPEIYRRTAARLGVEPRRCLFLDDSEVNIRGAGETGMRTVHWPDREEGFRRFRKALDATGSQE
jgi:HAD superfamily hydrolase (TIGR01509 family)